jgi:hypothetical protein
MRKAAVYLREREANLARGQLTKLQALENVSDLDLLRKWAWMSAIFLAVGSFLGAPILLMAVGFILPFILSQLLWILAKIAMALTCAMLGTAIYLTFFAPSDASPGG